MEERQSVELSLKLERLLIYTRQLFPENDSKFVEGMIKRIFSEFYHDEIGQKLLIHLLESLPEIIGKYSDMMRKKEESIFKIGYLLKDATKEAAQIGLTDKIKRYEEEINNNIYELRRIEHELHDTCITIEDRLHKISAEALKPNISDKEIKELSERWTNNALRLYIEAKRAAYRANKTGIGYDLVEFTNKKLTYELLFRFHRSPEDAYNKGSKFAETEIIPIFKEAIDALKGVNDKYYYAITTARSFLKGRISDEQLKNIEKRYLYLLAIFVLIGGSLFLIGNKETMMAVFNVNIIPLSLILGVIIVLLFIYFFINSKSKK
jgi:hypothetical protein